MELLLDVIHTVEEILHPPLHVNNNEINVGFHMAGIDLSRKRTNRTTSTHVHKAIGPHVHNIKPVELRDREVKTSRYHPGDRQHEAIAVMPRLRVVLTHDGRRLVKLLGQIRANATAQRERTRVFKREPDAGAADVRAAVDRPQPGIDRELCLHHSSLL